nr:MAG TPA: hypothetical protein [Caudoviricetes sp.]
MLFFSINDNPILSNSYLLCKISLISCYYWRTDFCTLNMGFFNVFRQMYIDICHFVPEFLVDAFRVSFIDRKD